MSLRAIYFGCRRSDSYVTSAVQTLKRVEMNLKFCGFIVAALLVWKEGCLFCKLC